MEYVVVGQLFVAFATFVYLKAQNIKVKVSFKDEQGNEVSFTGKLVDK